MLQSSRGGGSELTIPFEDIYINYTIKRSNVSAALGSIYYNLCRTLKMVPSEIAQNPNLHICWTFWLGWTREHRMSLVNFSYKIVIRLSKRQDNVLGFAGAYGNAELQSWTIRNLRARYIIASQDSAWILQGSR